MIRAPIRLAIVGGRRGQAFDIALAAFPERVILAAICDPSEEVLDRWRQKYPGAATYTSYDRLLDADDSDAVFLATPMPLHARQAIAAMRSGRHVVSEVIAATTLEECWELVETVESTRRVYMMAENYCFTRSNMLVLNMVQQGVFGETTYAEGGYIHDTRNLMFDRDGNLTWRGEIRRQHNGNTYPTHSLGPVAQWLGVGRDGDRFVSTATWMAPSRGSRRYALDCFGPDHPAAGSDYFACGDSATTLIQTAKGKLIVLRRDIGSPRPHNMTHYVLQGERAAYVSARHDREDPLIWIDGRSPGQSPGDAAWDVLWDYADEYEHPRWRAHGDQARAAGHGGGDFFVLDNFAEAILTGSSPSIDVYDAVTWSSIMPLSIESVKCGGAPVDIPDFRRAR